jgi:competence protein ComEC
MSARRLVCAAIFLAQLVSFVFCIGALADDGQLEVTYFDVGQADAVLINCPDGDHNLLIDAADTRYPDSKKNFEKSMNAAFDGREKQLTIAVASHPHADHIGSMEWVLKNFTVDTYVDNGEKGDTAVFGRVNRLRKKLVQRGQLVYVNGKQNSFEELDFCPSVTMKLIEPWAHDSGLKDTNDRSVAVHLKFQDTSFLFVGDIEDKAEEVMLEKFSESELAQLKVDVLKVGHHGSDTSSLERFVDVVSPSIAVISCGKKGVGTNAGYKHPRVSTLRTYNELLKDNPDKGRVWAFDAESETWKQTTRREGLWVTSKDGPVTVTSDGADVRVNAE